MAPIKHDHTIAVFQLPHIVYAVLIGHECGTFWIEGTGEVNCRFATDVDVLRVS